MTLSNKALPCSAFAFACLVPSIAAPQIHEEGAREGSIEEIVVTAQRREQNLSDVPLSIDAIGGERIQLEGIEDVQRLAEELPALVVAGQSSSTGGLSLALRGVGSTAGDPAVGFYIDEVYQASAAGFVTQFLDVERVEVLKGPQGTLWGRNTTGGAVHYITKGPVLNETGFETYAEVGTYDSLDAGDLPVFKVGAAANLPLGERLALRVSAAKVKQDNYTDNVAMPGTEPNQDATTLRADLLWSPTDSLSFELGASYVDDPYHNAFTTKSDPYFEGSAIAFLLGFLSDVTVENDTWSVSANGAPAADFVERGLRLEANWDLSDKWTLRSISAHKKQENRRFADLDGLTITLVHNRTETEHDWWSQEFQAQYESARLSFIGGAYYFGDDRDNLTTTNANWGTYFVTSCNNSQAALGAFAGLCPFVNGFDGVINPAAPDGVLDFVPLLAGGRPLVYADFLPGGLWDQAADLYFGAIGLPEFAPIFQSNGDDSAVSGSGALTDDESVAVYGQASYRLTDAFSVTAGLRYLEETKNQFGLSWAAGTGFFPNPDASGNVEFDAVTPKIGLEWRPADDMLAYVSATRGYKSGAINLYANIVPGESPEIEPETLWAYEVGFKGSFADDRVSLDTAAFYYDYSDYQYSIQFLDGPRLANVPDVSILGMEADLRFRPVEPLVLGLSFSYVDSKIESELEAIDPFNLAAGATNVEGRPLPRVPEWKATANASYIFDLATGGSVTTGVSMNYSDEFSHDLHGTFPGSGYTIYNANLRYANESGKWWANLYARNITNEEYQTLSIFADSIGEVQFFAPPRTIGIQVGYRY